MKLRNNLIRNIVLLIFLGCISFEIKCARQAPFYGVLGKNVPINALKSNYSEFLDLLKPIAVRRVSGTQENEEVRNFIKSKMQGYGWFVEIDNFKDMTPYGLKKFSNIIANLPIGAQLSGKIDQLKKNNFELNKRVIFACHYDSKYFANFRFIAATDSAVPCALLLDMAKFLNENFNKTQFDMLDKHIQFLFFDGEEAFKDWTDNDSLYGSRYYARALNKNYNKKAFNSIQLFVLLDLIGSDSSSFPNYFPHTTNSFYRLLSEIENHLSGIKVLSKSKPIYFNDLRGDGKNRQVADDHKPFLNENVPILHLIPSPFPKHWHKAGDNLENLNKDRIQDIRMIMKFFLHQILQTSKNFN